MVYFDIILWFRKTIVYKYYIPMDLAVMAEEININQIFHALISIQYT